MLFAAFFPAHAQSSDSLRSSYGVWDIVPFLGYAQHSPVGRYWGQTPDVGHRMLGVQLSTRILQLDRVSLAYAPNVVPLLLLTGVPTSVGNVCHTVFGHRECQQQYQNRKSVLGLTVSPLGLSATTAMGAKSNLIVGAAAGMGFFPHNVPVPNSRQVNVVLEWGGAFTYDISRIHALELGYKFHHISNAYTSEHNPGVDANLFFLGWKETRTFTNQRLHGSKGEWQIAPYTGVAVNPTVGDAGFSPSGTRLFTTGIQFATPMMNVGKLLVDYSGTAAPLIILTGMPRNSPLCLDSKPPTCVSLRKGTVTGASVSPFGLSFSRANPGKFDFSISGSIGGGLFSRSLPVPEAQKVKVILEWGPKISYQATPTRAVEAGVKRYRLWSSYADANNPRIDANIFYLGLGWRKSATR